MQRWMENFILLHMPVCDIYIVYICVCAIHSSRECTEDFMDSDLKKGNGRVGKQTMEVARLVNDEQNGCRFEVQVEVHWLHT